VDKKLYNKRRRSLKIGSRERASKIFLTRHPAGYLPGHDFFHLLDGHHIKVTDYGMLQA
jgi:hypothetical protein